MAEEMTRLTFAEARRLCIDACVACGGSREMAVSLAEATLSAMRFGRTEVGFHHLIDYLDSMRDGRIDGAAVPRIFSPLPAFISADAEGGIAQTGFDQAYADLVEKARSFGIAVFTQKNCYTAGELGYYVRRLALDGLMSIAAGNGPGLMTVPGSARRVFCTNPIAFGAPSPAGCPPLVIDQASSASAFVKVLRAADEGRRIPEGWAVDEAGLPTTDPVKAIAGALLPFGGYRGANIALMVEMLSAGLSGADWSADSGDFRSGSRPLRVGMTVIALAANAADASFAQRNEAHLRRLEDMGIHIAGSGREWRAAAPSDLVEIDTWDLKAIRAFAEGARF